MSVEIATLAFGAGDIVVIRTNNPHVDGDALSRASGAHVFVIGLDDKIEELDSATMRRLGWVAPSVAGEASAAQAEAQRLAELIAERDVTIAGLNDSLGSANDKVTALSRAVSDAQAQAQQVPALTAHCAALEATVSDLQQRLNAALSAQQPASSTVTENTPDAAPLAEAAPVDDAPVAQDSAAEAAAAPQA